MSQLLRRLRAAPHLAVVAAVVLLLGGLGVARATFDSTDASSPESTSRSTQTPSSESTSGESSGSGTGSVNNEVVLFNRADGSFLNRAGFGTARVVSDTVDNQNSAAAYSSCTDCRTVAVAVQVVLVQSNANVVTPRNVAVAINYDCQSCQTFAGAYQYVVSTDGLVRFTPEGQAQMAAIQNEIRAVAATHIPFAELDARLDSLVDRLWATVDDEMVKLGIGFEGTPHAEVDTDTSEGATSPSPSLSPSAETPSPAPSDPATPEATSTEEEASSPIPTQEQSPSPTPSGSR